MLLCDDDVDVSSVVAKKSTRRDESSNFEGDSAGEVLWKSEDDLFGWLVLKVSTDWDMFRFLPLCVLLCGGDEKFGDRSSSALKKESFRWMKPAEVFSLFFAAAVDFFFAVALACAASSSPSFFTFARIMSCNTESVLNRPLSNNQVRPLLWSLGFSIAKFASHTFTSSMVIPSGGCDRSNFDNFLYWRTSKQVCA